MGKGSKQIGNNFTNSLKYPHFVKKQNKTHWGRGCGRLGLGECTAFEHKVQRRHGNLGEMPRI